MEKAQREDSKPHCGEEKEDEKEKESRKRDGRPKARQTLGKSGRWLFLLLLLAQNWLSVRAAAEGPPRRTEVMEKMQQDMQVKGGRWTEEIPQRWGSHKVKTGLK